MRRPTPPPITFGREPLLHWVRSWLPDLRIGYALVDGTRRAFASFIWGGELLEFEAADDDAIVVEVANALREHLGMQPIGQPDRRDEDEREIVAAAIAGHPDQADALGRSLVERNAAGRRSGTTFAQTRFGAQPNTNDARREPDHPWDVRGTGVVRT